MWRQINEKKIACRRVSKTNPANVNKRINNGTIKGGHCLTYEYMTMWKLERRCSPLNNLYSIISTTNIFYEPSLTLIKKNNILL
jgi:hypothetical protein